MCVRVFSVGFGPGLDSMSPARSRRSASHVAGTHGWLPQKTGRPGLLRGGVGGYNLHSVPPNSPPRLWHTNHEQAVSVWCKYEWSSVASCSFLSTLAHTFLRISGVAILASKYKSSTLDTLRHPVISLHALFISGSRL